MKVFVSYNFADALFVQNISYFLRKQRIEVYCYSEAQHSKPWETEVGICLSNSDAFLLILNEKLGRTQVREINAAMQLYEANNEFKLLQLKLHHHINLPPELLLFTSPVEFVETTDNKGARACAKKITETFGVQWIPDDDLPIGYPFDYEKRIIEEYRKDQLPGELISLGCPAVWPTVEKKEGKNENHVNETEIGLFADWDYNKNVLRESDPQVVVAALTDLHPDELIKKNLTLPEARARKMLYYPKHSHGSLTVGIMVSGGIAPGINSVISGIVERQFLYAQRNHYRNGLRVNGYYNGLNALLKPGTNYAPLSLDTVTKAANTGGSILGTSRAQDFMDEDPKHVQESLHDAVTRLSGHGTEILYIIGGDGSMRAAHALHKTAQDLHKSISIVGIPKTMDNDILWVWQSFGFLSSVQWSKEAIQQLHTEASSNPRLCVIQLFGSDSGFVVTHAVTASGVCDLFLIPEVPFEMSVISEYMMNKLNHRYINSVNVGRENTYGVVVMSETAIPQDALDYIDDPYVGLTDAEKREIYLFLNERKCRVFGQTPDDLRTGGMKLVSRVLQKNIRSMAEDYWRDFRVFTNEPRHLIRSIPPSSSDIIFAHRLGCLAVDCAMAGYTDFMISQWLTEYVMVPLKTVTLGRKRIPKDGIFYKSARASTEQPVDLTSWKNHF